MSRSRHSLTGLEELIIHKGWSVPGKAPPALPDCKLTEGTSMPLSGALERGTDLPPVHFCRFAATAILGFLPLHAHAQTEADYSGIPSATDTAGIHASSADYAADFSSTPGTTLSSITGSPASYSIRSGWSGQLYNITGLTLSANPSPVPETSATHLNASFQLDDGTTSPLTPAETTTLDWTIHDGPIVDISASGLVTTAAVIEDTAAIIRAIHDATGVTDTVGFTVTGTDPDNYPGYADDGLPDAWQRLYFPSSADGSSIAQNGDYDRDGVSNLLEYAFGTNPASSGSGNNILSFANGVLTSRGQPVVNVTTLPATVDFRAVFARRKDWQAAGLTYRVQLSGDLLTWANSASTPAVLATDGEIEAVSVPYPFFVGGRKARFFRVVVTGPSIP